MKKLFILFAGVFILQNISINAQDTIVLVNGSEILSKVTEITSSTVKYKEYSNIDGPDYILENREMIQIRFANGSVKNYTNPIGESVEYINDVPVTQRDPNLVYENDRNQPARRSFETNQVSGHNRNRVKPGQTYAVNKLYYNPRNYIRQYGDLYDPALAGVASYFIPGLGQMICGETGRGLAFMGGIYGSYVIGIIGMSIATANSDSYYNDYYYSSYGSEGTALTGTVLGVAGLVTALGLQIYNIVDAVRVAKVNNMYHRDLRESYVSVTLKPFIGTTPSVSPVGSQHIGLTLSLGL